MSMVLSSNGAATTLPLSSPISRCCLLVQRYAAIARQGLAYVRLNGWPSLVLLCLSSALPVAQAQVCFDRAGTFGSLTVTTNGPGCGTFLPFGGINGLWLGNTNTTENCTFNFAPAVTGSSIQVQMTAHSCVGAHCEIARFAINGSHYAVWPGELNNSQPPGVNHCRSTAPATLSMGLTVVASATGEAPSPSVARPRQRAA